MNETDYNLSQDLEQKITELQQKLQLNQPLPPDFVDKKELVKASALPLSQQQRLELLKSSVPPTDSELPPK